MTTVGEIAEILEANKGVDVEVYVRIETIRGKPVAFMVREPRMPSTKSLFAPLRRRTEG